MTSTGYALVPTVTTGSTHRTTTVSDQRSSLRTHDCAGEHERQFSQRF